VAGRLERILDISLWQAQPLRPSGSDLCNYSLLVFHTIDAQRLG
jgi:hypothetical protein